MGMKRFHLLLMVGSAIIAGGCAQVKQYTPQQVQAQYTLAGLPASLVHVKVTDLRAERANSAQLLATIKQQIRNALSPRRVAPTQGMYTLQVDIIEHRSYFTLGNWNASTKLHVDLKSPQGKVLGAWNADGTAHRSNMLGYSTAKAVSQDAYDLAIANLMSDLSDVVVGNQP